MQKSKIKRIIGTEERPRLSVYRSLKHIYAQIIDDYAGKTLASVSTLEKEVKKKIKRGSNLAAAKVIGEVISQKALKQGIKKVVFDRGGRLYHGRVKTVAEAARAGGLEF